MFHDLASTEALSPVTIALYRNASPLSGFPTRRDDL